MAEQKPDHQMNFIDANQDTTPDGPPDTTNQPDAQSIILSGYFRGGKASDALIGGTVAAVAGPPLVLGAVGLIGFGAAGIGAGTIGSWMMSLYGGAVSSGSIVSVLQSIGAAGFGVKGVLISALGTGAFGAAAGAWLPSTWRGGSGDQAQVETGQQNTDTGPENNNSSNGHEGENNETAGSILQSVSSAGFVIKGAIVQGIGYGGSKIFDIAGGWLPPTWNGGGKEQAEDKDQDNTKQ